MKIILRIIHVFNAFCFIMTIVGFVLGFLYMILNKLK